MYHFHSEANFEPHCCVFVRRWTSELRRPRPKSIEFTWELSTPHGRCVSQTLNGWYIYLHLVSLYGKLVNVGKYTIHWVSGFGRACIVATISVDGPKPETVFENLHFTCFLFKISQQSVVHQLYLLKQWTCPCYPPINSYRLYVWNNKNTSN